MKIFSGFRAVFLLFGFLFVIAACGNRAAEREDALNISPTVSVNTNEQNAASNAEQQNKTIAATLPNLQAEILDERNKTTASPIGEFDFRNYIYPLPRGWQDADGKDAILEEGERRMAEKRIGLSYVTTKYGDATGDGADDAFVILKIVTAGSAIPQIVYVFTWKGEKPELIWYFRTGDRADGGLKDLRSEAGELVVELFGQDRFLLGEAETSKITGDEEQICCPTYFTRTRYKWNGKNFLMQGKRLTFSVADKDAPPVENKAEIIERQSAGKKK